MIMFLSLDLLLCPFLAKNRNSTSAETQVCRMTMVNGRSFSVRGAIGKTNTCKTWQCFCQTQLPCSEGYVMGSWVTWYIKIHFLCWLQNCEVKFMTSKLMLENRGQQPVKGQLINIFGFASYVVPVVAILLCYYSRKATTDYKMNGRGCVQKNFNYQNRW